MSHASKGIVYLSLANMAFMGSGYVVNLILGKYLGPQEYGYYGLILALTTVINLIQTSGIPQAASKFIADHEERREDILKSALLIQIILTSVLTLTYFIVSPVIANLLHDTILLRYIQLSALIFPAYGLFSLYLGYYNGNHQFGKQAVINCVYSATKVIAILGLGLLYRLPGAIIGFIIAPLVAVFSSLKFPSRARYYPFSAFLRFSLPLVIFALIVTVLETIDLFFLKAMRRSLVDTGYYTAVQNITLIPSYALAAFSTVLFPTISKSTSQGLHDVSRIYIRNGLRYLLLILVPGVSIMSVTAKQLLTFLYGSTYLPGADALSILVYGIGSLIVYTMLSNILNSVEQVLPPIISGSIGLCITIGICLFLIPSYGMIGAAIGTTAGSFIALCIVALSVYRHFGVLTYGSSIVKITVISLSISFIVSRITISTPFLPLIYFFAFVIYSAGLYFIKEIRNEDMILLRSVFHKQL